MEEPALQKPAPLEPTPLKIGEFARRAGVSLRTLRYYEELGLLQPTSRTRGKFRCYREGDLHRLRLIQSLQELGLRLERIGRLLDTPDPEVDHEGFLVQVRSALAEEEELFEQQIARLGLEREKIRTARAKLAECDTCEHVPTDANNHCDPCRVTGRALPDVLRAHY
jgi:DNA-binding transcriptional MerR regulator